MSITSVNLSSLPFQGSNDSSRAQMSSKQVGQSLVHRNCEIPYVIGDDYRNLTNFSFSGIHIAPDSGRVLFRDSELIILYYDNLQKIETRYVPLIKKTTGNFASTLRFCLGEGDVFQSGNIIYSYDDFRSGVPSYGYNTFTGYFSFFGLMKAPFTKAVIENLVNSGKL